MKTQHTVFASLSLMLFLLAAFAAPADDYFNRITVFSDGKITRFTQMPIRIYITPMPVGIEGVDAYLADLRYAMREWEIAADKKIQFKEVEAIDA
ncbi:MAG: hypothetical protein O7E52_27620, partial [Candidatus Poribacteria bacterium]|nr:hypothetical protein [Candidatus Poribacteria bacterium]